MDLKIPKVLSNRVFDNGYSKHFRHMTSGTKLKKMIKVLHHVFETPCIQGFKIFVNSKLCEFLTQIRF